MGEPITGAWARRYQLALPYQDARKWGTGVNPVHRFYGGAGRPANAKLNANQLGGDRTPTHFAVSEDFIQGSNWGYSAEDPSYLDAVADEQAALHGVGIWDNEAHPNWEQYDNDMGGTIGDPPAGGAPGPVNPQTMSTRATIPPWSSRPWGAAQATYNRLRSMRAGQGEGDTPGPRGTSSEIPTETVSEGWINKAATGFDMGEAPDDYVLTSDPSQYEIQTSMTQRHKQMVNDRAVARGTDEERTSIASRIAPMKLKVYSGEERHYDMFPYQIDDIPRPFYFRTAGTGPQEYMETNDQWIRTPLQRTPPPDPSMGVPETRLSEAEFGYSSEDQGYY